MKRLMVALGVVALLGGCATTDLHPVGSMLPGQIVSLSDGRVLPMQIELTPLSHPSGKMLATDTASGEVLSGTYTAILGTSVTQVSRPTLFGDQTRATAVQTSDIAQASAVLVGNKGTVLNLHMQIKAGNPPVGFGDGEDNKGRKYSLQF